MYPLFLYHTYCKQNKCLLTSPLFYFFTSRKLDTICESTLDEETHTADMIAMKYIGERDILISAVHSLVFLQVHSIALPAMKVM